MASSASVEIVHLSGFRLPEDSPLRRDHTRPPERRSDHYLSTYDDRTVLYDCVYLEQDGGYLITAPRFLNLWKPFKAGLRRDGQPVRRLRRVTWLRCEQIFLPGPKGELTLEMGGTRVPLPVREDLSRGFAGLDTLVAVSKNNHLDWIAHWAGFHARDHGTRGVVLFDNGSTDYDLNALAETLGAVDGLERVVIYSAPFPYGPADRSGRFDVSPRFFQTAMLNLARREALSRARAVLSIDIDEMILGDGSVYDAAVRAPLGMVTIKGTWVYPDPATDGPVPQSNHVFRAEPDKRCNSKWCMTPRGPMSRLFGWAVHKIGGVLQDLFTQQKQFRLIHCRAASTGWKKKRFRFPKPLVKDPALEALMKRHADAARPE